MSENAIHLRCLIIIANRGLANEICDHIKDYAHFQSITLARGTATSEIRLALGALEPEKEVAFCFVEKENVQHVFEMIDEKFELSKTHNGIALTVPVSSVGGMTAIKILTGKGN